jgi:tetratricopeptide (TPR) repeat protein
MNFAEQDTVFKRGLEMYRLGLLRDAAREFRRLIEDGSTDPRHLSYCGLLIGISERNVQEGLKLCEKAVEEAYYDPEMYLNLATLHARTGKRSRATQVLLKGLRVDPENPALLRQIARVNPRSAPMLPFLSRKHPLNKYLGLARSRLFRLTA